MLFVELALIRWTGERVLYLSFFSNFVLLGSFLGIGIGFLRAGRREPINQYAPLALAVLIGFLMAGAVAQFSPLPYAVRLWAVLAGLAVTFLVGIFFGLYPANRAARLDPGEALRHE